MKEEEDNDQDDDKVQEEENVNEGEEEEAGWSKGEGESEKEQSPEGEEIGAVEGEEAGRSEGDSNIGNGDFTAYRAPFSDFSLLKHHSHPFFVIVNAMSKLDWGSLTPEQQILFNLMQLIQIKWSRRLDQTSAQPRTSKRRRSDDEPPDDNGDDGDGDGGPKRKYKRPTTPQATPLKRQTRAFTTGANVGKGKVKQTRANEERSRARSHRQSPHPELRTSRSPAIDEKISLDASEVSAWADTVAAAGPPEKVDHIVF